MGIGIGNTTGEDAFSLYTSAQNSKVKGLQSAYMATRFGSFGTKSLDS